MRSTLFLAALLALLAGPSHASPTEVAKSATDTLAVGVTKTESAAKRGGSVASDGIQRGVRAVNEGADSLARKLGLPKGTAADARKAQDTPQRKADVHADPSLDSGPPPAAKARAGR